MDCTINICVLNWNGGDDLLACINSIENNDSNDYKITVIDNLSSGNINNLKHSIKKIKFLKISFNCYKNNAFFYKKMGV